MNPYRLRPSTWVAALLAATSMGGCRLTAQDAEQYTPPEMPSQEQPEVLSRGPVHEAFAEPVAMQTETGLIAPQQPPPAINEVPPEQKPQGQQFVWIPGYWAWDADRTGYIWVSACWRVAPPRMSWMPGYWSQVPGGWEWVSGYWAPAGVQEVEYLPAPPAVEDLEPVTIQPTPDTIWVPPCMYWVHGRYVRRAGYWLTARPDWVWVPSHYVMTPRGYIFAEGHWDYSLERRGVLFAPVYFPAPVYRRVAFTYSPSIVIDVGLLRVNLFAYPRYSHYYFGDYYDRSYLSIGIYPWFESRRHYRWYDPVYEHDRWRHHRSEPHWEQHRRDDYRRRCDDRNLRPAHTFREQESRLARLPEPQRRNLQVTQPISVAAARQKTPMKFEKIDTGTRQKISRQASEVRTFRDERNRWEAPATGSKTAPQTRERGGAATPTERKETVRPTDQRKPAVTPPTVRQETVQPTRERGDTVPPTGRRETVQPTDQRKPAVTPPTVRQETVQPTVQRKPAVTPPTVQQGTVQPTVQRKPAVIPPTTLRQETVQPAREVQPERRETVRPTDQRKPAVMPQIERTQAPQPLQERKSTVTAPPMRKETAAPVAQRTPAAAQPREIRTTPQRMQIPTSPVVGKSGTEGIFRRGPPNQPGAENRGYDGRDIRRDIKRD